MVMKPAVMHGKAKTDIEGAVLNPLMERLVGMSVKIDLDFRISGTERGEAGQKQLGIKVF